MTTAWFRSWLCMMVLTLFAEKAFSTHIVSGHFEYRLLARDSVKSIYKISLILWRDCRNDGTPDEVPFDRYIDICGYDSAGKFLSLYNLSLMKVNEANPVYTGCSNLSKYCLQRGVYEFNIDFLNSLGKITLTHIRCCRPLNNSLVNNNINYPVQGISIVTTIPLSFGNNSHVPGFVPMIYRCGNDTSHLPLTVTDADGDEIRYSLVAPMGGGNESDPLPTCKSVVSAPSGLTYLPGYSAINPFGNGSYIHINDSSGMTSFFGLNTGSYCAAIQVDEYRNKIKINSVVYDLQFLFLPTNGLMNLSRQDQFAFSMSPNPADQIVNISNPGNFEFTIAELTGKTLISGSGINHAAVGLNYIPDGIYLLSIKSGGKTTTRKLVVAHNINLN